MVSAAPPVPQGRINLRSVKALCVDSNAQGLDILGQMLMGFGVERSIRVQTVEEARRALQLEAFDLVLSDANLADESGFSLVSWLRRSRLEPNRYAPAIIIAGHASMAMIDTARDSGASFVISKPTSPAVLMQRILWVAKGGRTFVEAEDFVGPDRRWKFDGPPAGGRGRRKEDLSVVVGEAKEPNLSQDAIDAVLKPQRVSL